MLGLQCESCGQRNAGWRAICKRCGAQLQRFFAPRLTPKSRAQRTP